MTPSHAALVLLLTMGIVGGVMARSAGPERDSAEARLAGTVLASAADLDDLARHEHVRAVFSERARDLLLRPQTVTLHAIEPMTWRGYGYGRHTEPTPLKHALDRLRRGDGVLGTLPITSRALRRATLKGLFLAYAESGGHMLCYHPRHALVYRGRGQTVMVLICFQCFYAVVLEEDTERGRFYELGNMDEVFWRGARYPFMGLLNGLLKEAGIERPKKQPEESR